MCGKDKQDCFVCRTMYIRENLCRIIMKEQYLDQPSDSYKAIN